MPVYNLRSILQSSHTLVIYQAHHNVLNFVLIKFHSIIWFVSRCLCFIMQFGWTVLHRCINRFSIHSDELEVLLRAGAEVNLVAKVSFALINDSGLSCPDFAEWIFDFSNFTCSFEKKIGFLWFRMVLLLYPTLCDFTKIRAHRLCKPFVVCWSAVRIHSFWVR